jgi:hypothetical protein
MIHRSDNGKTAWKVLHEEVIYGGVCNFGFATKFSDAVDALVTANCNTQQIEMFFQHIGINVYEEHVQLYLSRGITKI